ncbi:transposase family protein [Streptomyces sp. NPDC020794]|uniref:transposase family protein n=1 Tax=unclassified Streptomyces TaxID=2593676 RepID=UPI0036EB0683
MDLEESWTALVFAGLDGELAIKVVRSSLGLACLIGWSRTASEGCPDCGLCCERVHDRYQRRVRDLPLGGRPVVITLLVRRFICDNRRCARRTFAERFTRLTTPYARCTRRLGAWLEVIGLALAGRAGARLAKSFGIAADRMTFPRRVMSCPILSAGCRGSLATMISPPVAELRTPL